MASIKTGFDEVADRWLPALELSVLGGKEKCLHRLADGNENNVSFLGLSSLDKTREAVPKSNLIDAMLRRPRACSRVMVSCTRRSM